MFSLYCPGKGKECKDVFWLAAKHGTVHSDISMYETRVFNLEDSVFGYNKHYNGKQLGEMKAMGVQMWRRWRRLVHFWLSIITDFWPCTEAAPGAINTPLTEQDCSRLKSHVSQWQTEISYSCPFLFLDFLPVCDSFPHLSLSVGTKIFMCTLFLLPSVVRKPFDHISVTFCFPFSNIAESDR